MAVVQSFGALQSYGPTPQSVVQTRHSIWDTRAPSTYATIYKTQPNVRTVVSFLARNIAQLGLHWYKRVSPTDRVRLYDYEAARWIAKPNPGTTHFRLIDSLMQDLGIYFNAFWLKVRTRDELGLVRLPPEEVSVDGYLLPTKFIWTPANGTPVDIKPRNIVAFGGYNPADPILGLSPIETLRQILAAEAAGTEYRRQFLQNSARLEGVVLRPKDAPRWTPEQKQSWRQQWADRFAGQPGQVAVLEDGMSFVPTSYSARESEFSEARKLTREECAAAYHVPLPMVGILEHATFSNIREQHKNLYQDSLGPWLVMIEEELERQLMIECDDQEDVYPEFNIAEKMKGSFEEQAASFQTMVGAPIMTVNEGRARLNLPAIKDESADKVVRPLNMTTATEEEQAQREAEAAKAAAKVKVTAPAPDKVRQPAASVIRETWRRQRRALAKDPTFDLMRWNRELASDLEPLYLAAGYLEPDAAREAGGHAASVNDETARLLSAGAEAFGTAREAALYGF